MKILLLILVAVSVTACGTEIDQKINAYPAKNIDPQLREVMEYWVGELAQRGLPTGAVESMGGAEIRVLRFVPDGKVKRGATGSCDRRAQFKGLSVWERTWGTVEIEERYRTASVYDLRTIVGHELGHCWFGFEHSDVDYKQLMSEHPSMPINDSAWFENLKLIFLEQIGDAVER